MVTAKRFEVWQVQLNPTVGSEIGKVRPCVIVSPDEANRYLSTVIAVPLTSTCKSYPTRVDCFFKGKNGQLAIDQMRSIDKARLYKKMGKLDDSACKLLCAKILEIFTY